jgi:hypothetical protein
VTVIGRDAFYPVTVWEPATAAGRDSVGAYVATRADTALRKRPLAERQQSYAELAVLMAVLVAGFVLVFGVLQAWTAARVPAAGPGWYHPPELPPGTPAEHAALRRNVLRASLLLHREMYVFLRFLALCGALLPATIFVLRPNAHGSGVPAVVLASSTAVVGLVALVVIRRSGRQAWWVARRAAVDGVRYALHAGWGSRSHQAFWLLEVVARSAILVVGVAYAALVGHFMWRVVTLDLPAASLFFQRASSIGSGVSPATPLILSAAGFAMWCSWHLVRISLLAETTAYEEYCLGGPVAPPPRPAAEAPPPARWRRALGRVVALDRALDAALDRLHRRQLRTAPAREGVAAVRQHLLMLIPGPRGALLLCALTLLAVWLSTHFQLSLEAAVLPPLSPSCCLTSFDLLLRFGVLATIVATSWALYRFLAVWAGLRRCLRAWSDGSLLPAFGSCRRRSAVSAASRRWVRAPRRRSTARSPSGGIGSAAGRRSVDRPRRGRCGRRAARRGGRGAAAHAGGDVRDRARARVPLRGARRGARRRPPGEPAPPRRGRCRRPPRTYPPVRGTTTTTTTTTTTSVEHWTATLGSWSRSTSSSTWSGCSATCGTWRSSSCLARAHRRAPRLVPVRARERRAPHLPHDPRRRDRGAAYGDVPDEPRRRAQRARRHRTGQGHLERPLPRESAPLRRRPHPGLLSSEFPAVGRFLFSWVSPALHVVARL